MIEETKTKIKENKSKAIVDNKHDATFVIELERERECTSERRKEENVS